MEDENAPATSRPLAVEPATPVSFVSVPVFVLTTIEPSVVFRSTTASADRSNFVLGVATLLLPTKLRIEYAPTESVIYARLCTTEPSCHFGLDPFLRIWPATVGSAAASCK